MVPLSAIRSQQAAATVNTDVAVDQLVEYIATYLNDIITYRVSDMILAAHSDASYLNERLSHSHVGDQIFLSENFPRNVVLIFVTGIIGLFRVKTHTF